MLKRMIRIAVMLFVVMTLMAFSSCNNSEAYPSGIYVGSFDKTCVFTKNEVTFTEFAVVSSGTFTVDGEHINIDFFDEARPDLTLTYNSENNTLTWNDEVFTHKD